ncbi:PLD nuclease N-terminal domain-containing protein [Gorillibacterium massiliense]|uniref:PLD nuclease N-terminal domain-containing protein n=1 Tax=Gorillibacterium massiliense TaxID=1280390 RepID=UPI0004B291F5|nr:PLD nuclease N-terminal domain-containing protein [Gorillibacterium massiliense]
MNKSSDLQTFLSDHWQLFLPLFILQMVLMIVALVDCIRSERTRGPKWAWALVILAINIFGPVAYFVAGRRRD